MSQEMNDQHEPFLVFRRGHQRPNQLFISSFKYLGRVLALAGDRALAEARSCVEGKGHCLRLIYVTIITCKVLILVSLSRLFVTVFVTVFVYGKSIVTKLLEYNGNGSGMMSLNFEHKNRD